MKMPIIVGDMRGIENTIPLFEGVPLGEVLRNKSRVDGAVDDDMTDMDVLRAKFLVDAKGLNKVSGQPFKIREITDGIKALMGDQA